jgi:hypothetical protein
MLNHEITNHGKWRLHNCTSQDRKRMSWHDSDVCTCHGTPLNGLMHSKCEEHVLLYGSIPAMLCRCAQLHQGSQYTPTQSVT